MSVNQRNADSSLCDNDSNDLELQRISVKAVGTLQNISLKPIMKSAFPA